MTGQLLPASPRASLRGILQLVARTESNDHLRHAYIRKQNVSPALELPIVMSDPHFCSPCAFASPAKRISELVPPEESVLPAFQIMRRTTNDRSKSSSRATSTDGGDLTDDEAYPNGSTRSQGSSKNKKFMTMEEREAAYNEARSRIFSESASVAGSTTGTGTEISSVDGDAIEAVSTAPTESEYAPSSAAGGRKREEWTGANRGRFANGSPGAGRGIPQGYSMSGAPPVPMGTTHYPVPQLYDPNAPSTSATPYGPPQPPMYPGYYVGYYPYYYPMPPPAQEGSAAYAPQPQGPPQPQPQPMAYPAPYMWGMPPPSAPAPVSIQPPTQTQGNLQSQSMPPQSKQAIHGLSPQPYAPQVPRAPGQEGSYAAYPGYPPYFMPPPPVPASSNDAAPPRATYGYAPTAVSSHPQPQPEQTWGHPPPPPSQLGQRQAQPTSAQAWTQASPIKETIKRGSQGQSSGPPPARNIWGSYSFGPGVGLPNATTTPNPQHNGTPPPPSLHSPHPSPRPIHNLGRPFLPHASSSSSSIHSSSSHQNLPATLKAPEGLGIRVMPAINGVLPGLHGGGPYGSGYSSGSSSAGSLSLSLSGSGRGRRERTSSGATSGTSGSRADETSSIAVSLLTGLRNEESLILDLLSHQARARRSEPTPRQRRRSNIIRYLIVRSGCYIIDHRTPIIHPRTLIMHERRECKEVRPCRSPRSSRPWEEERRPRLR